VSLSTGEVVPWTAPSRTWEALQVPGACPRDGKRGDPWTDVGLNGEGGWACCMPESN
jgi:hypothetical protein